MKLLIINDSEETLNNHILRTIELGIAKEDVCILAYVPDIFPSWKEYIKAEIEFHKKNKEKLVILLDRNLVQQNKYGKPILKEDKQPIVEDSQELFYQLIESKLLKEGDIIICDSNASYEQFNEFNNFSEDLANEKDISYKLTERGEVAEIIINGITIACPSAEFTEDDKEILNEYLKEVLDIKQEGNSEKNEINQK